MAADRDRVLIRAVPAAEVRPLRLSVLRPNQTLAETVYEGDELPDTVHLAAVDGDRVVGIGSLYREDRARGPSPGWRLRGMATAEEVRGAGFGAAVLGACVDRAAAEGGVELWCNAREAAIGFYRRGGFEIVSEPFDVPGIGAHVVMARPV